MSHFSVLIVNSSNQHLDNTRHLTFEKAHHFCKSGAFEDALKEYSNIIREKPDFAEAFYYQGNLLLRLRQFDKALDSFNKAIALNSTYFTALNDRGIALIELERFDEALDNFSQILRLKQNDIEALNNRGNVLRKLGRLEEALSDYNHVMALNPECTVTLYNKGIVLKELHRYKEALKSFNEAILNGFNTPIVFFNRGHVLHELGQFKEALDDYHNAIRLKPDYSDAYNNCGNILKDLNQPYEALEYFNKALSCNVKNSQALSNRANILRNLSRFNEAIADYDRAIQLNPDEALIYYNKSIVHLLLGHYKTGWEGYEFRPDSLRPIRHEDHPAWKGDSDLSGKVILLYSEQGYGDIVQFCRYASLVAHYAERVIVQVPLALKKLVGSLSPSIQVIAIGEPIPDYYAQNALMSLPYVFGTLINTIPAPIPYLSADPSGIKKWQSLLGEKTKPRIGLTWSGNTKHPNDHNRSMPLLDVLPLMELPFEFYVLQKDVRETDQALLEDSIIQDYRMYIEDFSDTAALISEMDLVISVDTSIVHIAGAIGKPVWVLLPHVPDWRWMLNREDSPWYPTARLFRQSQLGNWDNVMNEVKQALHDIHLLGPEKLTQSYPCSEPNSV